MLAKLLPSVSIIIFQNRDYGGNLHPNDIEVISRSEALGPAYAVTSNAEDMLKWMEAHMSANIGAFGQAIKDVRDDGIPCTGCRKSFEPDNPVTDTEVVYALGTRTGNYRQYSKINHSGSFGGYNSYVYMLPHLQEMDTYVYNEN